MKQPVVVIGIGEMGGVFSRGLLRAGHPVFPVRRESDVGMAVAAVPEPLLVVVAVAENDLHPVLEAMPEPWRERLVLLQNELLPRDWQAHGLTDPTVIAVWFEKKKGMDHKVIIPSPAYGPRAKVLEEALGHLDIPVQVLADTEELVYELVRKNVYILTTNIAGLVTGGTVGELWEQNQELAREVAGEIMDIQTALTGTEFDRERLIQGMLTAFDGDPGHQCTGRSAPARLQRALAHADEFGLGVPKLREIAGSV